MKIFLMVGIFALTFAVLSAKRTEETEEDYDIDQKSEEDRYNDVFDLRGTLRKHFGFEAFRSKNSQSTVCSPLSALLPLGKLALGAHGQGLKELNNAIGVPNEDELDMQISEGPSPALIEHLNVVVMQFIQLPGVILDVASRLYVAKNHRIYKNYSRITKTIFKSSVKKIDLKDPIKASETINDWVDLQTHGMIPTIINPEQISPESSLVIVNAIYFAGKWKRPFSKISVQPFFSPKGTKDIPMMTESASYEYVDSDVLSAQLVKIPYHGEVSSFLVVLPKKENGLSRLLKQINAQPHLLPQEINAMALTPLNLTIPKFKIESSWDLKDLYNKYSMNDTATSICQGNMGDMKLQCEYFPKIGLKRIFNHQKSGLTSIVRDEQLEVTSALQKVIIEVNELGTKAAAASVITGFTSSMIKHVVRADHPFLFYIMLHTQQLFAGYFNPI